MELNRTFYLLSFLLVGSALSYILKPEVHERVVQKRRELEEEFSITMQDLELTEVHLTDLLVEKSFDSYSPFGQIVRECIIPSQEEIFDGVFVVDVPDYDGEKVFRQIYNKELREGAELGFAEIFLPFRTKWEYLNMTCRRTETEVLLMGIKNRRRWKYSDFGLRADGSPGYIRRPKNNTIGTGHVIGSGNLNGTSNGTPNGHPNGSFNGTSNGTLNGTANGRPNGYPYGNNGTTTTTTTSDELEDDEKGGIEKFETVTPNGSSGTTSEDVQGTEQFEWIY